MRHIPLVLSSTLVMLLLSAFLSGGVGVDAAADPSLVGANLSVPTAPAAFGYGVNFGNPAGWNNRGLATVAARAGANSARIKLPEYHFARWGYDIEFANGNMAAYQANGLTNLTAYLIGPTTAHSTSPTGADLDRYSPRNLYEPIWSSPGVANPNNYWAAYVYQTVSRYKGQVKIWEVWNEPDSTSNWQATQSAWWTSPPTPRDLTWWNDTIFAYIRLLRVTYEVAKALDPTAFVAIGGIGHESFLDAVLRYTDNPSDGSVTAAYPARGGAWFDAVSFHHYPHYATYDQENQSWLRGTDSDAMATSFVARKNTLRLQLDRRGYDGATYPRKLWLSTESGVSSKPVGGFVGGSELQRNYLLKLPILAQANGVVQVDWFQLADTEADSASGSPYAHMGLYYNLSGQTVDTAQLKPPATGYRSVGSFMVGQRYDAAATAALALPAGARGYVFRLSDGRKSYALWAATAASSEVAGATVQLRTEVALVERRWDFVATQATRILAPVGGSVTLGLSSTPVFLTETTGSETGPSPTSTPSPPATWTPVPAPMASPTPTGGSASGAERLVNGGFEGGLANWYVPSWFANLVAADGTRIRSGARALRFQGSSSGLYSYQAVPASPGELVSFSGWVNVAQENGSMSMVVDLVPRHQYNGDLGAITMVTLSGPPGDWVRIGGSAVMPDRTVSVRLRIRFPSLNGTVYLDDLSLQLGAGTGPTPTAMATPTAPLATATPTAVATSTFPPATPGATAQPSPMATATVAPTAPAGQLLVNGGFEGGLANWYVPSWFASTASATASSVHGGARALRFKGNAAGPYTYQEVAALPGQRIDFSGWMNLAERYGDFWMVVELVARSSSNGNLAVFPITSASGVTGGWVPIGGSAVMPDRTAKLRVQIRFPRLNGTVYFDDLSVTR